MAKKKQFKEGDQIEPVFCWKCDDYRSTTLGWGDVVIEDGPTISNVLRGTCDICREVITFTPETATAIRKASEQPDKYTSFRIPRELAQAAHQAALQYRGDVNDKEAVTLWIKAFFGSIVDSPSRFAAVARDLSGIASPVLAEDYDLPISIRGSREFFECADKLAKRAHLRGTSEVFRRAVLQALKDDKARREFHKLLTIYS